MFEVSLILFAVVFDSHDNCRFFIFLSFYLYCGVISHTRHSSLIHVILGVFAIIQKEIWLACRSEIMDENWSPTRFHVNFFTCENLPHGLIDPLSS